MQANHNPLHRYPRPQANQINHHPYSIDCTRKRQSHNQIVSHSKHMFSNTNGVHRFPRVIDPNIQSIYTQLFPLSYQQPPELSANTTKSHTNIHSIAFKIKKAFPLSSNQTGQEALNKKASTTNLSEPSWNVKRYTKSPNTESGRESKEKIRRPVASIAYNRLATTPAYPKNKTTAKIPSIGIASDKNGKRDRTRNEKEGQARRIIRNTCQYICIYNYCRTATASRAQFF